MPMKVLISWSSGKDSAWMLHRLKCEHPGAAAALLTTLNGTANRVAMHAVRRDLLQAQAAAVGLPVWTVPLPSPCSNAEYERAMSDVHRRARDEGFTHVAFGDLFLEDVRRYREERMAGTGLEPIFPLWLRPTAALAREMLAGGLRARLTCVDPRALDGAFVGREFDAALLADLPPAVDPCGERGEFHTFAYDGPMFDSPIPITSGPIVERDGFVFADLIPIGEMQKAEGTKAASG